MSLVRASILTALSLAAAALAAPGTGNVNGNEQTVITKIQECIALEDQAAGIISDVADGAEPSAQQRASLDAKLDEAIACLDQAILDVDAGRPNYQASTDADGAKEELERARGEDEKAKTKAKTGKKIRTRIDRANSAKRTAILRMQGIRDSSSSTGLVVPEGTSSCAYRFGGAPRNAAQAMAWAIDQRDAQSARRARAAQSSGKAKGPPNYYLAFVGKGPTAAGFAFFNMGRELRGPFEVHHTAGFMSPSSKAEAALGNAFSCMELDVIGSSPLEFLSVCGRFTAGGFQAFANSRTSSLGQAFLPGVRVGTFRTTYDGVTFTCFVKPEGAPDAEYQQFATYVHDQGASLKWVAGVGGAQLGAKAEVGIDDFVIDAR